MEFSKILDLFGSKKCLIIFEQNLKFQPLCNALQSNQMTQPFEALPVLKANNWSFHAQQTLLIAVFWADYNSNFIGNIVIWS